MVAIMPNALAGETSPYLLQHADNPVDWRPWSDEAFELAEEQGKLVFLSVGYSTCHWCHVMAHESFEDPQVAAILNHHFVCIKVDREERPDIDALYMNYLHALGGQGGWPMSVWLTPDGSPVYGGTYFPPQDRSGRAGLSRVCHELARLWRDDRTTLEDQAQRAMSHLRRQAMPATSGATGSTDQAIGEFLRICTAMADTQHGGFGDAPKFPRPALLGALLELSHRQDQADPCGTEAWRICDHTLRAMATGGIHDQLGGGFHRYSVDRYWHVPHYEKMLYDQAQLALVYLEAWQVSGDAGHRACAEGIFSYLLGTMRDPGGAFHSAEDADSLPDHGSDHALEGAFWTWREDEVRAALEPEDAEVFIAAHDLRPEGNARPGSDPHGELAGRNTLYRASSPEELAERFKYPPSGIIERLERSRLILLGKRAMRPPPHRDDKILTAWNGMTIAALARGARWLERMDLRDAAVAAADFIRRELWHAGKLHRSHRIVRSEVPGMPADHACLIQGLLELHLLEPKSGWLEWAVELQKSLDADCWDDALQGYVMRPTLRGKELIAIREDYDGAEPSPNHLAIHNLLQLAKLTGEDCWRERAEALLRAGQSSLKHPFAVPVLVAAVVRHQELRMT